MFIRLVRDKLNIKVNNQPKLKYSYIYQIPYPFVANQYHEIHTLTTKKKEQDQLRSHLIKNKPHNCIICNKHLPLFLLETAHIKPRSIIQESERLNKNNIEFMCRYCHTLYDNGFLGVYNGLLKLSTNLIKNKYDLNYEYNKIIRSYNLENKEYFDYHFDYIYKK